MTEQAEEQKSAVELTMYEACLLHSRADRALRTVISRHLEQFDLTMMEWLLLATVRQGPKEGLTMTAIANTLDVTLPQVTALSASLSRAKLIRQKVSRQDRRSRRLVMTTTGQKLLGEVDQAIDSSFVDWTADIPVDQLGVYLETVKQLASRNHKL